jgi:hypothetical protein
MEKPYQDILENERDEAYRKLAVVDVDIGMLEKVDGNMVVGREKLTEHSSRDLTATRALELNIKKKENLELRIGVINKLLK